jgi:hypothetical protein
MLELSLHAARGPMVLDDLRALPDSPLVVAEGSTLPAQAVSSGIASRSRAVWLLPTCHASVPVPVAAPMAGPVLAPRHR